MALSPVQQNAIALRVKPKEDGTKFTIAEIVEIIGRSRQCWYNWMENEEFRQELKYRYDEHISLRIRDEIFWRLHFPNFPLDALIKLYLAEKSDKTEGSVAPQTITDLIRKAHEAKIETKTDAELKEEINIMLSDLQKYTEHNDQNEEIKDADVK